MIGIICNILCAKKYIIIIIRERRRSTITNYYIIIIIDMMMNIIMAVLGFGKKGRRYTKADPVPFSSKRTSLFFFACPTRTSARTVVNFLDANNAEQGSAPEGHYGCQGTVRYLTRINRSRLPGKGGGVVIKFHDRDVCKYTLCGVCPHRLFSNTKSDMGTCSYAICGAENPKMADPLKEWNELRQNEKDKYGYEYNTMLYLQKLVRGCDNKIVQSKSAWRRRTGPQLWRS